MGKGAGEKNGARMALFLASFFSPGSPVLGSLSPTQTSEPARRLGMNVKLSMGIIISNPKLSLRANIRRV